MRVFAKVLITMLIFSTSNIQAQTQNGQIKKFWQLSDFRANNQLMSDVNRSVYFTIARKLYPNKSLTGLLAVIEAVRKDVKLQDYAFLRFLEMYGNGELLRFQMADICGSYTLGNYVSSYIVKQYSKDKRYLQFVKTRQANRKDEIASDIIADNSNYYKIIVGHWYVMHQAFIAIDFNTDSTFLVVDENEDTMTGTYILQNIDVQLKFKDGGESTLKFYKHPKDGFYRVKYHGFEFIKQDD